ncbi:MAG: beta-propeller domain-containing protein [Candidatus Thiodiazotropha sp. LLP2]
MEKRLPSTLRFLSLGLLFAFTPYCTAADPTNQASVTTSGGPADATMSWSLSTVESDQYSALYDTTDSIAVELSISVDTASVGSERNLYLVARAQDNWHMRDSQGRWLNWNGQVDDLVPFMRKTLVSTEVIDVHHGSPLPPGEFAVYGGYEAEDGAVIYNRQPLTFIVFDTENPTLHRFRHNVMLENYLSEAMIAAYATDRELPTGSTDDFSPAPIDSSNPISLTNTQEQGVDEADLIKSDGQYLYNMGRCSSNLYSSYQNCIFTYAIEEQPASNRLLSEILIPGETPSEGIYLLNQRGEGLSDMVVTVGGETVNNYVDFGFTGSLSVWDEPRYWSHGTSEVNLFSLDSADTPTHERTLSFDGAMISSRVIGDTLYMVTRHTPIVDELNEYAYSAPSFDRNRTLLESASLSQLIPTATTGDQPQPLIDTENCYLAPSATVGMPDPTIINIIAISMADPDNFQTSCFIGSSEVLYASQQAIYLVAEGAGHSFLENGEYAQINEVHKLALNGDSESGKAAEYRGSAQVVGHLGYEPEYKSYRMGEYQGVFRIATSIGGLGSQNSSTSVTLLREVASGGRLEVAGRLDGLGRPGEVLYASRFIGNRGYLITFKKVDPLYVLDLSDPENPVSLGELEVSGYSEYLHPVGENYLLGIGKEAVDAENSGDRGGLGFAWYQGVKVSLFDVSDPTMPTEVNSLVLGHRGTNSTILTQPHGFASLPQTDNLPMRFSIPVDLYNEYPGTVSPQPYTTWGWTHTGLYTFDVQVGNTPGVELVDQFIVSQNSDDSYSSGVWDDRSMILGDSVHYLHNQELHSSSLPARE